MSKETDSFDDLFRTKLKDLEVDTKPEDWEIIAKRLPGAYSFHIRKLWYAAAITLLLSVGTGILYWKSTQHIPVIVEVVKGAEETIEKTAGNEQTNTQSAEPDKVLIAHAHKRIKTNEYLPEHIQSDSEVPGRDDDEDGENNRNIIHTDNISDSEYSEKTVANNPEPVATTEEKQAPKNRKWSFGTGLGSLTIGTNNTANNYLLRSSSMEDPNLAKLNAPTDFNSGNMPRTNIRHKLPLSFGISINRRLDDNWALSTGLTYTLLRSEWETHGTYRTTTKQYLHFAGIPLFITYRIAEWKKFVFYASAGGMGELNFAGFQRTEEYMDDIKTDITDENSARIKEIQWSLGVHAGVSYPIIRHVSAFAEAGASYYFKNNSEIETIYTKKPFYISPQLGLRLSF